MSQFQCGGPSSQNPYPSPPSRADESFASGPWGLKAASGIKLAFARLSRSAGQVRYALLTRAPVASADG